MFVVKTTKLIINPNIKEELEFWMKLGKDWEKDGSSPYRWIASKSQTYDADLRKEEADEQ